MKLFGSLTSEGFVSTRIIQPLAPIFNISTLLNERGVLRS